MTLKVDDAGSEVKFQHFLKLSMVVVYVLFLLPPMMFQMMAFVLSIKQWFLFLSSTVASVIEKGHNSNKRRLKYVATWIWSLTEAEVTSYVS